MGQESESAAESPWSDYTAGLIVSVIGHVVLAYYLLWLMGTNLRDFEAEPIYSVTIETGAQLGGISQVPKDDKKHQVAPPKNQSEPSPVLEQATIPEVTDAEVSLATKAPESTPVPAATPVPTGKPTVKPTIKATAKPTAKPTPKPTVLSKAQIDKEYQKAMQRYLGESTQAGGKGFGAGKVGDGKGMGGGVLRPPEFFRYRDLLEIHVKQGWRWFDPNSPLRAKVSFEIAADGRLSNIELAQSSGNREFDESVLRAVYKASPVPAPPQSVYEAFFRQVRIEFKPE